MMPYPSSETEELIHDSYLVAGDNATLHILAEEPLRVCVFRARTSSSIINLTIKDIDKDDKSL